MSGAIIVIKLLPISFISQLNAAISVCSIKSLFRSPICVRVFLRILPCVMCHGLTTTELTYTEKPEIKKENIWKKSDGGKYTRKELRTRTGGEHRGDGVGGRIFFECKDMEKTNTHFSYAMTSSFYPFVHSFVMCRPAVVVADLLQQ